MNLNVAKNTELKSVLSNTFFQFLVKTFSSLSTLIITILISYFLGIPVFGSFTKIVSFVTLFYLVVDFGINGIYIHKSENEVVEKLGQLISLRTIISAILYAIIGIVVWLLPYDQLLHTGYSPLEKIGILLYSLTIFTQGFQNSLNALLQKNKNYKASFMPSLVSSIFLLLIVILGVFIHSIFLILLAYVISGVIFCSILFYVIKRANPIHLKLHGFSQFSKQMIFLSFPLAIMLLFNLVYAKADILILAFLKPTADVGIYGFSYRVFEFCIAIPIFFANSIYPILIEKKNVQHDFLKAVRNYSLFLFTASVLCTLIIFIFSPLLSFVKSDFSASVLPLQILSLSFPFFFLTSLFQWVLVIQNKKIFLIAIYFFSMVINIALNIVFIPQYTYLASSVITVVCEGIIFLLMIGYFMLQAPKNLRI